MPLIYSAYIRGTVRKWQNNAVPLPQKPALICSKQCTVSSKSAVAHAHTIDLVSVQCVISAFVWVPTWKYFSTRQQQTLHHLWLPHLPKLHMYLLPFTAHPVKASLRGSAPHSTYIHVTQSNPDCARWQLEQRCITCAFTVGHLLLLCLLTEPVLSVQKVWKIEPLLRPDD